MRKKEKEADNTHMFRYEQMMMRSLYISTAIWVGVAGVIAYYFEIITPITIFANLLVVPLISVIVTLGFTLLIIGCLLPGWVFPFAFCLKITLNFLVGAVFVCAKIPYSHIHLKEVNVWHIGVYYTFVLVIVCVPWRRITQKLTHKAMSGRLTRRRFRDI